MQLQPNFTSLCAERIEVIIFRLLSLFWIVQSLSKNIVWRMIAWLHDFASFLVQIWTIEQRLPPKYQQQQPWHVDMSDFPNSDFY